MTNTVTTTADSGAGPLRAALAGVKDDGRWIGRQVELGYAWSMRPTDFQPIGRELAIKWDDGSESYIPLETLRRYCPCAGCKGEPDITGAVHKGPEIPLMPRSFQLVRIERVGSYAIQPVWADGHATGLYSFEYLKKVSEAA